MTFSPWLEDVYKTVSKDLDELPQWKQDALRREVQFSSQKRQSDAGSEKSEKESAS
jgi:hypothetical protein